MLFTSKHNQKKKLWALSITCGLINKKQSNLSLCDRDDKSWMNVKINAEKLEDVPDKHDHKGW